MQKLLKVKEWLTVNEAAAYLSATLAEPVSPSDIFRLALDKTLTLSVYFVDHVIGRLGEIVPIDAAVRVPGIPVEGHPAYDVILGVPYSQTEVLQFEDPPVYFDHGIFDILMIGGERISCEKEYQRLTGGPAVDHTSIDGTFLYYRTPKTPRCAMRIPPENEREGKFVQLLDEHPPKVLSDKPIRPWNAYPESNRYPAGTLPSDAVFVVRTEALQQFVAILQGDEAKQASNTVGARERSTYLNIIGALLELVQSPRDGRNSDAAVIQEMVANYNEKAGISERTLAAKFAEAKRSLRAG